MFALYLAGVISAVVVAFVLKSTLTRGRAQPLLMEMPTYKLPDPRDFFINLSLRGWAFLRRAGIYIFWVSVVLWFLASFPSSARGIRDTFAGALSTVYALQTPDGDTAGLAHALQSAWSLPTALAFLAWYVFAPQCIATIAVARREMNSLRWTVFMVAYLLTMAYVAAGVTYWTARWAGL